MQLQFLISRAFLFRFPFCCILYISSYFFFFFFFFFLNDPPPPEIYPLPLHDALPISFAAASAGWVGATGTDAGSPFRHSRVVRSGSTSAGLLPSRRAACHAARSSGAPRHCEIGRAHV